jgi:hypothetical protein
VAEWLTVLSRRDFAVFMQARRPGDDEPARVLLARFAQWWVTMERSGNLIRITGAGSADTDAAAEAVLESEIERLCGERPAAPMRPATLDADELRANGVGRDALCDYLASQHLDTDQVQLLTLATDQRRCAQTAIVVIRSGVDTGRTTRTHVEQSAVAIIDTPQGRLLAEHVCSAGTRWLLVSPGTAGAIVSAINRMVRRLPMGRESHSYRKAG